MKTLIIPFALCILVLILGCIGMGGQSNYGDAKVLVPMQTIRVSEHVLRAVPGTSKPPAEVAKPVQPAFKLPPGNPAPLPTDAVTVTEIPILKKPTPKLIAGDGGCVKTNAIPVIPIELPTTKGNVIQPIEVVDIEITPIEVPEPDAFHATKLLMYYFGMLVLAVGAYVGWKRYHQNKPPTRRRRRTKSKTTKK